MKRLLVLLSLLLPTLSLSAQWVPVGPPGGAINVIRVAGDRVYAAGDAGVFVSTDRGASWDRLLFVPDLAFSILEIDPQNPSNVYVVAAQHASYFGRLFTGTRLYKSTDAGMTWREISTGFPNEKSIASLTIDAQHPSTLYAALQCAIQHFSTRTIACDPCAQVTGGAGIYKSDDGGETWRPSSTGLSGENLCVRGIAADALTSNVVYAYSETMISTWMSGNARSTDGGVTWVEADPLSPSRDIVAHSSGRRFAIATPASCRRCSPESAVVVSDDGNSWRSITKMLVSWPVVVNALAIDPRSADTVYVATTNGLFVTNNLGASWSPLAPASEFRATRAIAMDEDETDILYLGTSTGLFVSRDGGATWSEPVLPHYGASVTALAVAPDGTLYGVLQDFDVPRTVVRSTDGGVSWEKLGRLSPSPAGAAWWGGERPTIAVTRDGTLYVIAESPSVLKRYEGGGFIDVVLPRDRYPSAIAADPRDPHTLYVAAFPGDLLKSTDRGATWRSMIHREDGAWGVAVAPTTPTTVYFAVGDRLMRSVDGGETWSEVLRAGQISSMAVPFGKPETIYAIGCCNGGLLRSDDRGATWRQLRAYDDMRGIAVDPRDDETLYLRFLGGPGILRSTDGGVSWSQFNGGLTSRVVNDFVSDPVKRRVYAATFRGGVFTLTEGRRRLVQPR